MVAPERRVHVVPPEARGERLDQHLSSAFPDLTRSRIQALIDEGRVRIDGRAPKASLRIRGGERVELELAPPAPAQPVAQELPLQILYEDADLVVVDKAPGMVVHPAAGHAEGTLVNALLYQVKDLSGIGGELRPGVVHRLDKDTSGCLVVAKNELALAALQAAFKGRTVNKTYLALVHGVPRRAEGTIQTLYGRHPIHRKRFTGRSKSGKPAVTAYRLRKRFEGAALLEVDLLTGRTHQVRVHLSEMGHPLLCDALYGGARKGRGAVAEAQHALKRQALHAWKLAFAHPRTGQPLAFEAPLPSDFARALELLRPNAQNR
ncbi:MAG TPA: RluA family pseudouridine synthase [Myxococcaceae bacterium]|nr:RluA family pseudouridine synthase [Myxococcaceae bacterium]